MTTSFAPLYLDSTGVMTELADGALINSGGTTNASFTVGGKPLLFADGTSTGSGGGGTNTALTLQNAYNNSVAAAATEIRMSAGNGIAFYASSDAVDPAAYIDGSTGKLTLRGGLEVLTDVHLVQSTTVDSDHLLVSPASGTVTAFRIEPDVGVTPIVDLVSIRKIAGQTPVFRIDMNGNIHSTGTLNGVDVAAMQAAQTSHFNGSANRHTASQIDITPIASIPSATNVQQALTALESQISTVSGAGYEFVQSTVSTVWTIPHNKGSKRIITAIYNMDYELIVPNTVTLTDENTVTITFGAPQDGIAILTIYPGFYK